MSRARLLELEKCSQHLMSEGLLRSLLKSLHVSFYLRIFATSPQKLKHHRLQKLKLSSSRASQNENKRSPGSGILLVKNNFTLVDGFLDCLSV